MPRPPERRKEFSQNPDESALSSAKLTPQPKAYESSMFESLACPTNVMEVFHFAEIWILLLHDFFRVQVLNFAWSGWPFLGFPPSVEFFSIPRDFPPLPLSEPQGLAWWEVETFEKFRLIPVPFYRAKSHRLIWDTLNAWPLRNRPARPHNGYLREVHAPG